MLFITIYATELTATQQIHLLMTEAKMYIQNGAQTLDRELGHALSEEKKPTPQPEKASTSEKKTFQQKVKNSANNFFKKVSNLLP